MEILYYLYVAVTSLLLFKIAYIDFKTQYIYISDLSILAVVVSLYKIYIGDMLSSAFAAAAAGIFGYVIYKISYLIYQEEAFGLGDVFLLAILGCYWSWPLIVHFIYFSFLLAGIIGLVVLAFTRNRKYRIAFGPVLSISVFLYYLWGVPDIYSIVQFFKSKAW